MSRVLQARAVITTRHKWFSWMSGRFQSLCTPDGEKDKTMEFFYSSPNMTYSEKT